MSTWTRAGWLLLLLWLAPAACSSDGDAGKQRADRGGDPADLGRDAAHDSGRPGDAGLPGDAAGAPGDAAGAPGDAAGAPGDADGAPGDAAGAPGDLDGPKDGEGVESEPQPAPDVGGEPPTTCEVQGRVEDEAGTAIGRVRLILCDDPPQHCYSVDSGPDGAFRLTNIPPIPLGLKVLGEAHGFFTLALPGVRCEPGQVLQLEPLRLVRLPEGGTLVQAGQGGDVQVLPELLLHLPPGLSFPSFAAEEQLRAASLDPALLHPLLAARVQPLAVFAFSPFGTTTAGEPIGFTVRPGPPVPGELEAFVLDHATGEVVPLFTLVAEADGEFLSPPGQGLPELSWMMLAAPGADAAPAAR